MVTIYVTSLEGGSGKTTVCAGIGKYLKDDGKKVGFFKPVIAGSKPAGAADGDAVFIKQILTLRDSVKSINPSYSDDSKLTSDITEDFNKIARGKDVVIVEDLDEQSQVSYAILEALNARVIIVAGDSVELPGEKLLTACKYYKEHLLGVVLNKAPAGQIERVRSEATASFSQAGINILGVLPEDRTLLALSVGELAEYIRGEILNNNEKSAELVENVMLGALVVDPGPDYYGRKVNKAAVLRTERQDMQMAALETSTRALVLSGDAAPTPLIRNRAENKSVPIIQASDDVASIVANIEDALAKTRFNQENKLTKLVEIMKQHFNFEAMYKGSGLAG